MKKVFNIIFYVLLGIVAILFINRIILLFSYNLDLGGLENYFAFLTLNVGSGDLYTDPEVYPFIVTQYPPFSLVITSYLAHFMNLFFHDMVRSVYVSGRIFNLIFNVITVIVLFRFYHKQLKFDVKKAALPGLILFTLFTEHAYAVRPDSLKMLLIILMYIQGYKYFWNPSNQSLAILILLGFLSMVAKQDAAIQVGLLGLAYFCNKQYLKAFKFGIPVVVLFFGFAFIICGYSWVVFYKNFILGLAQGIDFVWAKKVFDWNPFAMVAQLVMIITVIYWGIVKEKKEAYMPALLLFVYLFGSFNVLKWGSNFNYYFEFQILIICLFSYWIYKRESKFLSIVFYTCMAVFLFNNLWNRNLGLVLLTEEGKKDYFHQEKVWFDEYQSEKMAAIGLEQLLKKEGATEVIVFSRALSLLMYKIVVLGTTANEYPEWQFPYIKTVPERTYNYHLDCADAKTNGIRFITWDEVDEFHQRLIREMLDTNEGLQLEKTQEYGIYNFYKISCTN